METGQDGKKKKEEEEEEEEDHPDVHLQEIPIKGCSGGGGGGIGSGSAARSAPNPKVKRSSTVYLRFGLWGQKVGHAGSEKEEREPLR